MKKKIITFFQVMIYLVVFYGVVFMVTLSFRSCRKEYEKYCMYDLYQAGIKVDSVTQKFPTVACMKNFSDNGTYWKLKGFRE